MAPSCVAACVVIVAVNSLFTVSSTYCLNCCSVNNSLRYSRSSALFGFFEQLLFVDIAHSSLSITEIAIIRGITSWTSRHKVKYASSRIYYYNNTDATFNTVNLDNHYMLMLSGDIELNPGPTYKSDLISADLRQTTNMLPYSAEVVY